MTATRRFLKVAGPGMVWLAILLGPVPSVGGQESQQAQAGAADQKTEQEKLAEEKKLAAEKEKKLADEKKLAEEKAAEQKKLAGAKQGVASGQGAGEGGPAPVPNALWLEASVRLTKSLQELIAGMLGSISWAVVALVVVMLFREKLLSLFVRLVETIRERGGSVDIGTFKLQIAERDEIDEARPLFLPSPFDLEDDRGSDGGLLWEIPPQHEYQASDYVGQYREKHLGGQAAANAMRQAFAALELSCRNGDAFSALKPKLLAYVIALEEARFLEAAALAKSMASHTPLSDGIRNLRPSELPRDVEDFLIVHASAVALAQAGNFDGSRELLNDIPWKNDQPLYVPAGAMWLTASYHGLIASLRQEDKALDTPEVLTQIREFVERANLLAEELKKLDWKTVKLRAPKAYYTREFDKDIGDVLAIYAEHVRLPQRGKLLLEAKDYLERCVQPNADEPPTPLDHNNLADLYRQLGALASSKTEAADFYNRAHTEIEAALPQNVTPDPAFHDTLALLLVAENRLDEAAAVLDPYLGDDRLERVCAEDWYQCIRNQILAAKLSVRRLGDEGARRAIDILESALRLIAKTRSELRGKADALEAESIELLSFAHLRLDDHQDDAVAQFDRLIASAGWRPSPAAELRARVGRALALGGHARRERRHSSYGVAEALRARAAEDVRRNIELLKEVKLDASQSPERLRTIEGLWLDAIRAIQLLAEELYAGHESKAAQDFAGQELAPLLAALDERIRPDTAISDRRRVLRRVQARNALLRARLQLRLDPNLSTAETLSKVLESLQSARGAEAHLDCQADLEEGIVRLTAARLGTGDVEREYARAVEALERASRQDAPALRNETIRLLAHAYAMGPQVRRAKKSATK